MFGYRAGFGVETFYRVADGRLYASPYNGVPTNDPANRYYADSLATREAGWSLISDPELTARARQLAEDFPAGAFSELPRQACDALAYDGGCPYVGQYHREEGTYHDWHGNYAEQPTAGAFMQRVDSLVKALGE
ncbi:hypothetical protein CGL56_07780 [Neolewinella marina]|uniref:Uncharacterized protein n=1 Tax=Neolewinella marina TaxID=438751 RepID=A0A2G0CH89_9BACT|nr:hypothetical protein CGL56_07780 [Neolewinella marina]